MIKEYETYRKHPIFYFPCERNGVNMTRATVFGDRIDCTLLDLKYYYTKEKQCKLKSALERGAGAILSDYHSDTRWQWSDQYYENVKKASEKFMAINQSEGLGHPNC
ncbi:hypothetical protein [Ligilactobacillus agilis]|uniref:hypothetical protein n=1 Tax=Ligilactobacillus agilis TaxID=1601 RepID=UPI00255C2967|nr:hypothetical protein [Ligilactobacillus agilis]